MDDSDSHRTESAAHLRSVHREQSAIVFEARDEVGSIDSLVDEAALDRMLCGEGRIVNELKDKAGALPGGATGSGTGAFNAPVGGASADAV